MSPTSPWFVCFEPQPDPAVRLFCFPYAGGGAMIFRRWQRLLPDGVELWSIRLPGRETRYREPSFFRLAPLIDALEHEFEERRELPYAFFGHSLGALTGFELARRLERGGNGPGHVFVSAHGAPQHRPTSTPMHLAPDEMILAKLRRFGGTPQAFYDNPELVAALLPHLRRDFAVGETYRYDGDTALRCALTAFASSGDLMIGDQPIDDWKATASGPFRSHTFPGGHFFWNDDPRPLLDEIDNDLCATFASVLTNRVAS